jgi:hypothetical protein
VAVSAFHLGLAAAAAALALAAPPPTVYGDMSGADLGQRANLHGAVPFPADNAWNTDISREPVDTNSDNLIASIPMSHGIHPDFGAGTYAGALIGIPYVVVGSGQQKVRIRFKAYKDQSDPGPYPVPPNAPIEGFKPSGASFGGDRHVLVLDRDADRLYELYRAFPLTDGSWSADSGAVFHLDSNDVRPTGQPGWTSADAAGLPIFPGLVRYDEAHAGKIAHALRFTVPQTRRAYVPPATHWASDDPSPYLPPMGMRVRLKRAYVIPASFSRETKTILKALKTYGMFVADNGSGWYLSGAPDPRWDNDALVSELGQVSRDNFEVVRMRGIVKP